MSLTLNPNGRLRGEVALVTGSSSGIGRAIAIAYAQEGASVVCADLRPDARAEIKEEAATSTHELLLKHGGRAAFLRTDVTNEEDMKAAVASAVSEFGRLDVMVNNAGIGASTLPVHKLPAERWDKVMDVNARSVFLGCKYAITQMLEQEPKAGGDRGWIVNLASVAALAGRPGIPAYSASKGAVTALTRQIAIEYSKDKIHCNAICPGSTQTAMQASAIAQAGSSAELEHNLHPLKGMGVPQDVAKAAVFLASEDASWVTGVSLPIDGGFTAQ